MRGTQDLDQTVVELERFIPAYAGNTLRTACGCGNRTVHPRVCGEHSSSDRGSRHELGSSPRMRGTLPEPTATANYERFIPAYAGNTCRKIGNDPFEPVHPRVCGEHKAFTERILHVNGSSPRMRGTHNLDGQNHEKHRFIPAYAGNTNDAQSSLLIASVHPRVCGEHTSSA